MQRQHGKARSKHYVLALCVLLVFMVLAFLWRFTYFSSFHCSQKRFLGDLYGGWTICDPDGDALRGGIVYTVGVGRNIEWDKAMISRYNTQHHGWDPTPRAVDFARTTSLPKGFVFHPFGLGVDDGSVTVKLPEGNTDSFTVMSYKAPAQRGTVLTIPVLTIESMMRIQGHDHLAILKIDIEGAEFNVIRKWAREHYNLRADQVLIEFHERYFNDKSLLPTAIAQMSELGFEVFHRAKLVCLMRPLRMRDSYRALFLTNRPEPCSCCVCRRFHS